MRLAIAATAVAALAIGQQLPLPLIGTAPAAARSTLTCSSQQGGGRRYCPADTSNRVDLKRDYSGRCNANRWGYDRRGIWVRGGCSGEFAYGDGGGPGAGAVVGGVAVVGILAAILASKSNRDRERYDANQGYQGGYEQGYQPGDVILGTDVSNLGPLKSRALTLCLETALAEAERGGGGQLRLDRIRQFTKRGTQYYEITADATHWGRYGQRRDAFRCVTRYGQVSDFQLGV